MWLIEEYFKGLKCLISHCIIDKLIWMMQTENRPWGLRGSCSRKYANGWGRTASDWRTAGMSPADTEPGMGRDVTTLMYKMTFGLHCFCKFKTLQHFKILMVLLFNCNFVLKATYGLVLLVSSVYVMSISNKETKINEQVRWLKKSFLY